MFKDQAEKFIKPRGESQPARTRPTPVPQGPERILSSDVMRLQSAFIASVSTSIDIRYSLFLNFGIFLLDIPRRLGYNKALDAASHYLMSVYGSFCAGSHQPSPASLLKFGQALTALRQCLADPTVAQTSETICSVMILMMAQV